MIYYLLEMEVLRNTKPEPGKLFTFNQVTRHLTEIEARIHANRLRDQPGYTGSFRINKIDRSGRATLVMEVEENGTKEKN